MKKVFISYSHKDARWLDRLLVHLRPLQRSGEIELWADTRIAPGATWIKEIETALAEVNIAMKVQIHQVAERHHRSPGEGESSHTPGRGIKRFVTPPYAASS